MAGEAPRRPHVSSDASYHRTQLLRYVRVTTVWTVWEAVTSAPLLRRKWRSPNGSKLLPTHTPAASLPAARRQGSSPANWDN